MADAGASIAPGPISLAPYTAAGQEQDDPLKKFNSITSMMSTLADVQLKQRELQGQLQAADLVKQATDANGVFHQDQLGKLIATGKYPFAAQALTKFGLESQGQQLTNDTLQAQVQKSRGEAFGAATVLLAQQAAPWVSATGVDPNVLRAKLNAGVSIANQYSIGNPDWAQGWHDAINAAKPEDLPGLAARMVQQGQPPSASTETADVKTPTGVPMQVTKTAVPAAAAAQTAQDIRDRAAAAAGGGAPPAPPPGVTGFQGRSEWQMQGDAELGADINAQAPVRQKITNLQEIIDTKGKVNTGPLAPEIANIQGMYAQVVRGIGLKVPDQPSLENFNELQKATVQLARDNGNASDYDRMNAVLGNPSTKMDPVSLGMVSQLLLATQKGPLMMTSMAARMRKDQLATFDYRSFKSQFQETYDPRVAAIANMSKDEVRLMMSRMAGNKPAQQEFFTSVKNMFNMKMIGNNVLDKLESIKVPAGGQ